MKVAALLLFALVVAACAAPATGPVISAATLPPPFETPEAEPSEDAGQLQPDGGITLPSKYAVPSKRAWSQVLKAPDKFVGKGLKLWACVFQFDAATGDDGFLAYASYKKQAYWALDGDNAAFTGDAGKLSSFVKGDIVSVSVVVLGSYSYDTQAGGNTTVPAFQVVAIKRQKGSCD